MRVLSLALGCIRVWPRRLDTCGTLYASHCRNEIGCRLRLKSADCRRGGQHRVLPRGNQRSGCLRKFIDSENSSSFFGLTNPNMTWNKISHRHQCQLTIHVTSLFPPFGMTGKWNRFSPHSCTFIESNSVSDTLSHLGRETWVDFDIPNAIAQNRTVKGESLVQKQRQA